MESECSVCICPDRKKHDECASSLNDDRMCIKVKQGINNCYMTHKYEHPGYEEGMCAGLRTIKGNGEPCEECKDCALLYTNIDK